MSSLVAVVFDDESTAFEMRAALIKMQRQNLLELEDSVVVTRDAKGRVKLDQATNLTAAGAIGGGFWGLLIGMLFLNPLLGAAVGATTGAITGRFRDIGVDDAMVHEVGQSLKAGTSALFVLVRRATPDKVLDVRSTNPPSPRTTRRRCATLSNSLPDARNHRVLKCPGLFGM